MRKKHGRIIKNCLSKLYGHKRHEQFRGSLYYQQELETAEDAIARLRDILNPSLFQNIDESIRDGIADVQEASFIAGFSYCAKFLTNGKIDFFPEKGGAC